MSYKLYIKDSAETWQLLDMGNEKPAMNYQVNNITELKDMQTDYSQALVLPYSPNNCRHFGFSNEFDIDSSVPYMKFECRLFYRESVIAGKGSYLYVDRMSDSGFHTQILSGNVDLFETLKLRKMSEIDLGNYQLGTNNFGYQTGDYVIARANFIQSERDWSSSVLDKAMPFVFLKNAIEKLLLFNGYTLVTNLLNSDWANHAISTCSRIPGLNSFVPLHSFATGSSPNTIPNAGFMKWNTIIINGFGTLFLGQNSESLVWNAGINGTGRTRLKVIIWNAGTTINIKIQNSKTIYFDQTVTSSFPSQEFIYYNTIDLFAEDPIQVTIFIFYTSPAAMQVEFETDQISATEVRSGCHLPISKNLGFDTQYDFFKMFVQLYGMTVIVDNDAKKVYCFTSKKLIDNKQIAIDWSSKLHIAEFEHRHSLEGYAKVNFINFEKYQDDFATIEDRGYFEIADERLSPEKTLFTIGIESGENYSQKFLLAPLTVAKIPLWKREFDEETQTPLFRFEAGKPHIVEITQASSTYYATHVSIQEFISMYYSDFVQMLNGCKVIERSFNLSEEDIELYKSFQNNMPGMFIPVYISHFGRFFYINKIKNFVSGKLTKCELIKL